MSFPGPAFEIGVIPHPDAVTARLPELAAAAQGVYDGWDQDADGMDPTLGEGGICDLIADAFLPVLHEAGVEHCLSVQASHGENHVFVVCLLSSGVHMVDVDHRTYERGGGYSWRKVPGVRFVPEDVVLHRVSGPMTPDEFDAAYRD